MSDKKPENLKMRYFVRYPRMSQLIAIFKFFESFAFYCARSILTMFMVSGKFKVYAREKIGNIFRENWNRRNLQFRK